MKTISLAAFLIVLFVILTSCTGPKHLDPNDFPDLRDAMLRGAKSANAKVHLMMMVRDYHRKHNAWPKSIRQLFSDTHLDRTFHYPISASRRASATLLESEAEISYLGPDVREGGARYEVRIYGAKRETTRADE